MMYKAKGHKSGIGMQLYIIAGKAAMLKRKDADSETASVKTKRAPLALFCN